MNSEESIYISLQEATKHCQHSQEYLSLRARQGKLKSIKFGRNWVTKKEWLEEYLGNVEEYNNHLKTSLARLSEVEDEGNLRRRQTSSPNNKIIVAPPDNLPVELVAQHADLRGYPVESVEVRPQSIPALRFGFAAALVFVFLITGIFHNRESFKVVYDQATPLVFDFNENLNAGALKLPENISSFVTLAGGAGDIIVETPTEVIIDTISTAPQSFKFVFNEINSQLFAVSYQTAGIGEAVTENLKGYFQWFSQSYLAANNTLEKNLSQDIDNLVYGSKSLTKSLTSGVKQLVLGARDWTWEKWQFAIRPWKEAPIAGKEARPQPKEGAIVVPYPEKEIAEVKGKLEQAFSDKVEVKPDESGRAGIIKPLIREAAAQEYLYLIVPVSEQSE